MYGPAKPVRPSSNPILRKVIPIWVHGRINSAPPPSIWQCAWVLLTHPRADMSSAELTTANSVSASTNFEFSWRLTNWIGAIEAVHSKEYGNFNNSSTLCTSICWNASGPYRLGWLQILSQIPDQFYILFWPLC